MKTIGIKLADGSFYPVLNEGAPSERLLELTTAHNNQTKVMVDLYRSELSSMEDAEYVDSLQIENLIEHPNGEPTLTFTVSIDENNKLSAKMVDKETGLQSNATITLVSRTLEERLLPDEYDIKDPTIEGVSLTQTEENSLFGNDDAESNPSETEENPLVDFSFETGPNPSFDDADEPAVNVINEFEAPVDETSVETEDEITAEEVPVEEEIPAEESISEEEVPVEESPAVEETAEEKNDDTKIPEISDFNPLDEPVLEDDALNIDEFNTEEETTDENQSEEKAEEVSEEAEERPSDLATENSDIPDFTFDIPEDNVQNSEEESESSGDTQISEESNTSDDFVSDLPSFDFSSISDSGDLDLTDNDSTEVKEEDLNLDLDLPDFDSIPDEPAEETSFSTDSSSDSFNTDLDLSDLDTYSHTETPADDNSYLDDLDFDDLDSPAQTAQSGAKPISFTGLYDKETELGNSASSEEERKSAKPAVIICILCAIICVLATAFVLMVVPSKFSLFGTKTAKKEAVKTEAAVTELPPEPSPAPDPKVSFVEPAPEPEPITAPEPLPPVPQSKVEEVVIIENAEDVVPLPPPVKPVKPKDINYKIKWGDTLWDISDTYYKNPWRYKYIARYNGIKNPDYIISGTYITIPAE